MLKIERHDRIMQMLQEKGSILVSEACSILGCSDQTIRRDMQELEKLGHLKRIHGGAYIPSDNDRGVPVQLREKLIVKEKLHMAELAASSYIKAHDVIMLDSSTTCNALARQLMSENISVTLITNSAGTLCDFRDKSTAAKLICAGGQYNDRSGSFESPETVATIKSYVADKAFISCNALSMEHGMLDNNESQCSVRTAMLSQSRERYLLVDHTKFDDQANIVIGNLSILNGIITDREPDENWKKIFSGLGIKAIW